MSESTDLFTEFRCGQVHESCSRCFPISSEGFSCYTSRNDSPHPNHHCSRSKVIRTMEGVSTRRLPRVHSFHHNACAVQENHFYYFTAQWPYFVPLLRIDVHHKRIQDILLSHHTNRILAGRNVYRCESIHQDAVFAQTAGSIHGSPSSCSISQAIPQTFRMRNISSRNIVSSRGCPHLPRRLFSALSTTAV